MRQYKFRAWNGERMDYDYRDASLWNGLLVAEGDTLLMQFTGLIDRLGTDIYEGDIVQNQQPYFKGIVYFKRGSFWVREIFSHVDEGIYDGDREKETQWSIDLAYKIIGNIYETPDLLESH